jgi:hypothetical protein
MTFYACFLLPPDLFNRRLSFDVKADAVLRPTIRNLG